MIECVCVCVCVCVSTYCQLITVFCVEQHETVMADLNTKLKNTEKKLQSANICENNFMLHLGLFFTA